MSESCVVYACAPLGLELGPPPKVRCLGCQQTTAACTCYDGWFELVERVRVAEGPDNPAVSRG